MKEMMAACWLHIALLGILTCVTTACNIQRKITKSGFHRDLQTSLYIPSTALPGAERQVECKAKFTERIPAGAYVDPFQLKELLPYGGPKVFLSSMVDLEQPEYMSSEFDVDVFVNLTRQEDGSWLGDFTLPIHVRYHAVSDEEYVTLTLPHPRLALSCSQLDQDISFQGYSGMSSRHEESRCDPYTEQLCSWTVVQCHMDNEPVTVEVPVGKKGHYYMVTIATVTTTLAGCVFLSCKTIWSGKKDKLS